jgi:hypothetical protein
MPDGHFPARLADLVANAWPEKFLPVPGRRDRVNAIVAHHALRVAIRERRLANGGAVSAADLAAWVDSVVLYTRAVRSIQALRLIQEAGVSLELHSGGTLDLTRSIPPTAAQSGRRA